MKPGKKGSTYRPGRADSARSQGSAPDTPRMVDQPAGYYTQANILGKTPSGRPGSRK